MKTPLLAATGAIASLFLLAGCAQAPASTNTTASTTTTQSSTQSATVDASGNAISCTGTATASPALTEGPYYKTGDFTRSDITEGQAGMPMTLTLTVVDTN